jgi:hypothetical protein
MTKYDPTIEKRCADAIEFLKKNPGVKRSIVAANFFIRDRILKNRLIGIPLANIKGGHNKALDNNIEDRIKEYLNFLIYVGH